MQKLRGHLSPAGLLDFIDEASVRNVGRRQPRDLSKKTMGVRHDVGRLATDPSDSSPIANARGYSPFVTSQLHEHVHTNVVLAFSIIQAIQRGLQELILVSTACRRFSDSPAVQARGDYDARAL